MTVPIKHIVLAGLLLCPVPAVAGGSGWVEIAGSYYNPDWELRESENGVRLSGRYQRDGWYLGATYNTVDTKPVDRPGIVRLRGLPFGDWREITAGRILKVDENTSVRLEAAYQGISVFDTTESGYTLAAAIDRRFGARLSGSLRLGYLQLEDQDWRLTGELLFATGQRSAAIARIDDFAEFDFTWYELGVRFFF